MTGLRSAGGRGDLQVPASPDPSGDEQQKRPGMLGGAAAARQPTAARGGGRMDELGACEDICSWKLPSDARDRRAKASQIECKKSTEGEGAVVTCSACCPCSMQSSAAIFALTLGTSRGVKTTEGPLAPLWPNGQEREEEEEAASPGAERSILLTNCLLNGAQGTMPALSPGQSGLCKARGRHQRPRESPPGEWPLPPCLHNP